MTSRALTPVFQWLGRRTARPAAPGVTCYPAPVCGNHAGEAVFLAVATAVLAATAVVPMTAGLPSAWLRWPLALVLLFLLPHLVMALVSLPGARIAGTRWHRGVVQDWSCLAVMTGYAACRITATGWIGWVCLSWLAFMLLNVFMALAGLAGQRPGPITWLVSAMPTVRHIWLFLLLLHAVVGLVAWVGGAWAGFFSLAAAHLFWVAVTLCPGSTPFGVARQDFPVVVREVILTIDDGPCADTPAMLDLLDRYDAKAMFFLIGWRAAASPGLVLSIVSRGHAVGNHTLTHPAASFWAAGPARLRREIAGCSEILTGLTNQAPAWFRAPAGFRNPFTAPILRELNLEYLGWAARGFDTRQTNVSRIIVRLRRGFRPGAVLLIHQGHPHSIAVLEALLQALAAEGWRTILPPASPAR